ncbi:MAG: type III-A CRISPR-associated protein Csm2 [bacterium]
MSYFIDEKVGEGVIKAALLDEHAKKTAESFFFTTRHGDKKEGLTSAQLRRFYNDVKSIEKRIDSGTDFAKVLPMIKMIKSKVSYASNPKKKKVPGEFRKFIDTCINNISNKEDFKAFCKHFEAVVGYFYGEGVR